MRATIDGAGRVVVPKALRDELGLAPGAELELEAIDGRLEVSLPSRVRVERTSAGPRFVADGAPAALGADGVRAVLDRTRR